MKYRIEKDTLGEVEVPADVYYGPQTQHLRLSTESSDLMTVLSTNLVQRSKPMYLLKETRSTLQQRQKVRDMQVVLRDTA